MKSGVLEILEWDSRFFGYRVGRLLIDRGGEQIPETLRFRVEKEKIKLLYIFVNPSLLEINNQLEELGGVLVDQKVVYVKATELHTEFSNKVIEYQSDTVNEQLKELVLSAGTYSRFRLDPNFRNDEYAKLYHEWLLKSINKSIAFTTLVALKGTDIIGITTLGGDSSHADIGLVAVHDNYKGQGIGYDLMRTADSIAFEKGFRELRVVTQMKNTGACKLYEKCNFHVDAITNVYHYWNSR
jgi:dTDP-4-amino-4,6-dideoxy-D-galactose acyltransferase